MTPYLVRSGGAHALVVLLAFVFMAANGASKKKVFYTIDFVGGSGGPSGGGGAPAAKPAPAAQKAAVPSKAPLPSLKRWRDKARAATLKAAEMATPSKKKDAEEAVEAPGMMGTSRKETAAPAAVAGGGGTGASVSADLSNFPYPWYLSRLRDALWTQWSARMPDGASFAVVSFVIGRNGAVTGIAVSEGSGSSSFDYAAQSAVRAASPFPPLPEDYRDPTLRVHVRFETVP